MKLQIVARFLQRLFAPLLRGKQKSGVGQLAIRAASQSPCKTDAEADVAGEKHGALLDLAMEQIEAAFWKARRRKLMWQKLRFLKVASVATGEMSGLVKAGSIIARIRDEAARGANVRVSDREGGAS